MNRRDFVQSIVGAAVVATLPAPVVSAIADTVTEDVEKKVDGLVTINDGALFLYKDSRLLGKAYKFTLSMERDVIKVSDWASEWEEYIPGKTSWNIQDVQIIPTRYKDAQKLLKLIYNNELCDIVVIKPPYKITGEVSVEKTDFAQMGEKGKLLVSLEGEGQLIVE